VKELLTPDEYERLRKLQIYPAQPYEVNGIRSSSIGLYDSIKGVRVLDVIITDGRPYSTVPSNKLGYSQYLEDVVYSPAWSSYVTLNEFYALCKAVGFFMMPKFIPDKPTFESFFQKFILKCLRARHTIMHSEDENLDKTVTKLLSQFVDYGTIFLIEDH
jgi:hypothetical protein